MSDSVLYPWTVARQAPLFMELSRQEHWSGLPCPSPGDLPNPGIEPGSPALQAESLHLSQGSPIPCLHFGYVVSKNQLDLFLFTFNVTVENLKWHG